MMQQSRSNWIQIQGSYLGVFGRAVLLETSNSQDAINVQKTGYTLLWESFTEAARKQPRVSNRSGVLIGWRRKWGCDRSKTCHNAVLLCESINITLDLSCHQTAPLINYLNVVGTKKKKQGWVSKKTTTRKMRISNPVTKIKRKREVWEDVRKAQGISYSKLLF